MTGWVRACGYRCKTKGFSIYKRRYKKMICRLNRRKAKQNPEATDKKLDPWEII